MAPQAEDELFATYRDPATGDIPAGIRAAEMAYAGGLPRRATVESDFEAVPPRCSIGAA